MADEKVKVTLTLDSTQYQQMMKSASKHTDAVDESIKKTGKSAARAKTDWSSMGAAITVAGGLAVVALKKAVDAASDLNESTTKMRTIFGAASKDIEKFASTSATSLGMSKKAAMDAASMMATFGKAAGLSGKELTSFSTEMVSLSGDLASFYNSSPDEAMEAIGAALRGEAEPIRKYGVLLDDATLKNRALEMGIINNTKNALTPQQKALAAQAEILAQTSDAQGDFARTSDGLANQQRIAAAAMEDASAALGQALLPIVTKGAKAVAVLAEAFASLPAPLRDTVALLAGAGAAAALIGPSAVKAVKGVKDLAGWVRNLTVATEAATVATDGLTASSTRLAKVKTAGIFAGLAAAVVGAVVAMDALNNHMDNIAAQKHAANVDALAKTYSEAAAAGKSLNDVVTTQSLGANIAGGGLKALLTQVQKFGPDAESAKDSLDALNKTMADAGPIDAARMYEELKTAAAGVGMSVEDLNALLPSYIAGQKEAAGAAGEQSDAEKDKADALKAANDAQKKAIGLVTGYINAQMAAAGAADYLVGAQDRLTEAHKKAKGGLEGNSKASIANRDAMRSEVGAVLANVDAKIQNAEASGKTTVEAYEIGNAALKKGRKHLEDAAVAAGYNKTEVKTLLDEYMKLPKDVKTQVEATGINTAKSYLDDLRAKLDSLPKSVQISVHVADVQAAKRAAGVPGAATGGKVTGPGTGTSDTAGIYALSNGEWVVPAASASRMGDDYMSALVDGDIHGMATGGKVTKKKPLTAKQKAAAAKKKKAAAAKARKDAADAARDRRQALIDDIEWQFDMGMINLPQKIKKLQGELKKVSPNSEEGKALRLTIRRDQQERASDVAEATAKKQEDAAKAQEDAAEAAQKAADMQADAAKTLKDKADGIASSIVGALGVGQTQSNGKKWTSSALLGDYANRAGQARDFAGMVADLSRRGLSEEVINQVLSAGPAAGADLARALTSMSQEQLATVNANQGAIGAAGQWLGNALTYGNNSAITVQLSGGAPVVLQLDSRAIYEGQLILKRQMGGTYALTGS